MACYLYSLEKAFAYRQWWLAANVNMAFWLAGLWKSSSVFPRRCHYETSLHCHTVHRHTRPGLWMELTARDLACKFSSAFFLKGDMTHSREVLNIYVASWLTWILQFRWVSHIHKSLDAGEDLWLYKRKGEDCSVSETAYKIPTSSDARAVPYSSYFTGISGSLTQRLTWY